MTRAIILAAGRGSRMGKETKNKPKCLTLLKGKKLLEWQINSLNKAGIEEVQAVTGYKREQLSNYFKQTYVNEKWATTNMVFSLNCAPKSNGDTIISYSDITYSSKHVSALCESKHDITITADLDWLSLWSLRFDNPLEDAETFISSESGLISIGGKTENLEEINAQFMGLIKLTPRGWDIIFNVYNEFSQLQREKMDFTSLLNHLLKRGHHVKVEFVNGKWCECDSYNDVLTFEKQLQGSNWSHDWRE